MRKLFTLTALLMMTASVGLAGNLAGYLTDLKCAKAGKSGEAHAQCAQNCVKGGQPIAIVNEADQKVYKIENQDSVKDHVGHKVTLTGKVEGDSIHVESVKM